MGSLKYSSAEDRDDRCDADPAGSQEDRAGGVASWIQAAVRSNAQCSRKGPRRLRLLGQLPEPLCPWPSRLAEDAHAVALNVRGERMPRLLANLGHMYQHEMPWTEPCCELWHLQLQVSDVRARDCHKADDASRLRCGNVPVQAVEPPQRQAGKHKEPKAPGMHHAHENEEQREVVAEVEEPIHPPTTCPSNDHRHSEEHPRHLGHKHAEVLVVVPGGRDPEPLLRVDGDEILYKRPIQDPLQPPEQHVRRHREVGDRAEAPVPVQDPLETEAHGAEQDAVLGHRQHRQCEGQGGHVSGDPAENVQLTTARRHTADDLLALQLGSSQTDGDARLAELADLVGDLPVR
eukprot:CAMPEP_0181537612 /NCGR_PEP_ID=MMETSP1110-20121109/75441_1 /TAXON_ID=174948 /ORGANISM="Symbiodinium sp., Strain CCMP421" /LENGTH=346 /DNA_ID=CAMNT_0023669189 /DNA_START=201 /DNA_END=1241 /DNA_ORIENTATION=-